jgi:glycosyltransferase involved in cell wall biosynthesis
MSSPDNSIFSFSKKNFLKYGKDVKFLNFSKDSYLKYLRSVDCFVLPSYREGFSKTLLEASSAGKVVLTTNVPGCRDIVINKKTGILCSAKSVKSLIFHMNYVYLLTKSQRSRISLAGSLRVNKKFSCDKINREYLEIIKKLI